MSVSFESLRLFINQHHHPTTKISFMKKILAFISFIALGFVGYAQNTDEVIKGYFNAVGGADKMKALQSVKATGNFQQGGMNIPFVMYQKRPMKQLLEVTFQGMTQKIAYDGTSGWIINPFSGRTTAEKMDADQEKETRFQADIDGPFIDYAAKGYKVDYAGEEDIEGSPAYHLIVTTREGDVRDYYFDKDSYLMIKQKDHVKMQDGSTNESETNFSDYKEVNGILMPHTVENIGEFQGQRFSSFIKIDSIEQNVAIDDALFKMPDSTGSNK
jgi:outer membrane lipoprotein-sorting protein